MIWWIAKWKTPWVQQQWVYGTAGACLTHVHLAVSLNRAPAKMDIVMPKVFNKFENNILRNYIASVWPPNERIKWELLLRRVNKQFLLSRCENIIPLEQRERTCLNFCQKLQMSNTSLKTDPYLCSLSFSLTLSLHVHVWRYTPR